MVRSGLFIFYCVAYKLLWFTNKSNNSSEKNDLKYWIGSFSEKFSIYSFTKCGTFVWSVELLSFQVAVELLFLAQELLFCEVEKEISSEFYISNTKHSGTSSSDSSDSSASTRSMVSTRSER